jgi:hypothetical protein
MAVLASFLIEQWDILMGIYALLESWRDAKQFCDSFYVCPF